MISILPFFDTSIISHVGGLGQALEWFAHAIRWKAEVFEKEVILENSNVIESVRLHVGVFKDFL